MGNSGIATMIAVHMHPTVGSGTCNIVVSKTNLRLLTALYREHNIYHSFLFIFFLHGTRDVGLVLFSFTLHVWAGVRGGSVLCQLLKTFQSAHCFLSIIPCMRSPFDLPTFVFFSKVATHPSFCFESLTVLFSLSLGTRSCGHCSFWKLFPTHRTNYLKQV
jgi:hypothetical protein